MAKSKNNNKKRRLKKNKNTTGLIYVMTALFLAVYIPSMYNLVCGKSINVGYISLGEIEEAVNAKGYIIRDEFLIDAPFTGKYLANVQEGEKVCANQKIATVLRDGDKQIIDNLKELEFEILEAKRKKATNKEIFSDDISKLDKEIEKKVKILAENMNDSRYADHNKIKYDIDMLMKKKNEIIGENVGSDSYIETKISERNVLRSKLNNKDREIRAKKAGLISFAVDGFENVLKKSSIAMLDYKNLCNMKNIKKDSDNLFVKASTPFVKIISGVEAYVVVPLNYKDARQFVEGSNIKMRFNDINKEVPGEVFKCINNKDKILVVVKVEKALQYLTSYRVCDVDLISNSYSGYKILRKSLRDYDELTKMAQIGIVKFNKVKYKDVKVLGCSKEFAIIENSSVDLEKNINLYDRFVLEPENVVEGQIINGI